MSEANLTEFDQLVGRYLADAASPEDVVRLNAMLAGDPEAARAFARACRLDSFLSDHFRDAGAETARWIESQLGDGAAPDAVPEPLRLPNPSCWVRHALLCR